MLYMFLRNIIAVFYRIIFRFEIIGEENIPKEGGAVLCSNHRSNNDAIFLAICQKRPITFMGKDSLFKVPVLGFLLKKVGAFPVKRGTGDIGAIRTAVKALEEKNLLCIFPEGTRNKTAEPLIEFKAGAVLIAYKAGADIVPCAISGKMRPFSKIRVEFAKPFTVVKTDVKPDINKESEKLREIILGLYQKKS